MAASGRRNSDREEEGQQQHTHTAQQQHGTATRHSNTAQQHGTSHHSTMFRNSFDPTSPAEPAAAPAAHNTIHEEDPHSTGKAHQQQQQQPRRQGSITGSGAGAGLFSAKYTTADHHHEHASSATAPSGVHNLKFNANRRTSVSAEALNPNTFGNDNWKPPVHQLSHNQLTRLNASVMKNFLFSQLDDESLRTIIFALEEKKVPAETEVIKQGDEGDFFYVVEKGTVDYLVNGKVVNTSSDGSSFGELALMYNSPRAATVVTKTECILWALDRMTFRRILLEGTAKRRSLYENFLKEVPVLQSLSSYERSKLADALTTQTYNAGENIVTEGEPGENFYFIENGSAEVVKEGQGVVANLEKGDYFGELTLLYDSPRQATVRATTPLKAVSLNKNGFQRLLGPAVDILKLHDPTKQ